MSQIDEIKQLETLIIKNSEAYYSGKNCIPDPVFDHYVQRLAILDPENKVLKTTGWGMKVENERKQPHKYGKVIGIPDKIRPVDVQKKLKNLGTIHQPLFITPKLDGTSVLLYYENGKLEDALTRGDGEYGERILDKVRDIVPKFIEPSFTGRIRGEFIISKKIWNEVYAAANKSARNYGSGLLLRKENFIQDVQNFNVVCYSVKPFDKELEFDDQINFLNHNGFYTVAVRLYDGKTVLPNTNEECKEILNCLNKDIFECDGLVVIDYNNNQFAVKWNESGVETVVKDIVWQSSRLGKFSPVVIIEPVELSGATINRTSGFNYQYIKDTGLGIGSTITIVRSGDVIPYIVSVDSPSKHQRIPDDCPRCNQPLCVDGVNLICTNPSCPGRNEGTLFHFINTVTPVDGIGEKMLQHLFISFKITNIKQFIDFANTYEPFNLLRFCNQTHGLGKAAYNKFRELLDKYRNETLNLDKVLIGLGLPSLGEKSVETVLDMYEYPTLIEKLKNQEVGSIAGTSYIVIQSLYTYREYIEEIIGSFRNIPVRMLKKSSKSGIIHKGIKICITGALSVSRREFLEECNLVGIEEASIAKAIILVTNNPNSGSGKAREAQKRGTKIMTEEEFRKEFLS
jgi:DNA ligase (NAD+)